MTISDTIRLNNIILSNINITSQENNIIKSFDNFYQNNEYNEIFLYLISSKSNNSIVFARSFKIKR